MRNKVIFTALMILASLGAVLLGMSSIARADTFTAPSGEEYDSYIQVADSRGAAIEGMFARLCDAVFGQLQDTEGSLHHCVTGDNEYWGGGGNPGLREMCEETLSGELQDDDGVFSLTIECWYNAIDPPADVIDPNDPDAGEGEEQPTCGGLVDGIGWLVCPILNGIASVNDFMFGMIEDLLQVNPLERTGNDGNTTSIYRIWQSLLGLANIVLIIAFMVFIMRHLVGDDTGNYQFKKYLPKIILMAIAANTSFFLMQLAVDVFNVVGAGLYDLFTGFFNDEARATVGWEQLIGVIIAGAGVVAGVAIALTAAQGAGALLLMILPFALMALLGFLAALVTLMLRQALIPLLAILAPLAFAAYAIPGLQSWFNRWKSLLISMLMLYPMASVLFGGFQVIGMMIATSAENIFAAITGMVVIAAPLFMLPFLAKQTGPILSKVNGSLRGLAAKANAPARKLAGERADTSKAEWMNKQPRKSYTPLGIRQSFERNKHRRSTEGAAAKAEQEAKLAAWGATDSATQGASERQHTAQAASGAVKAGEQRDFAGKLAETEGSDVQTLLGSAYQGNIAGAVGSAVRSATNEQIRQAELNIPSNDLNEMARAFGAAVKSGDTIGAQAAANKMLRAGGAGANMYRNTVANAEQGSYMQEGQDGKLGFMSKPEDSAMVRGSSVDQALRQNVAENHGQIKGKAADIMEHAIRPDESMTDTGAKASTWSMADADFATQHHTSQKLAISNNAISAEQAERILGNERLTQQIEADVQKELYSIVDRATRPASNTGGSGAAPTGGTAASGPTLNVDHGDSSNNNPSGP